MEKEEREREENPGRGEIRKAENMYSYKRT